MAVRRNGMMLGVVGCDSAIIRWEEVGKGGVMLVEVKQGEVMWGKWGREMVGENMMLWNWCGNVWWGRLG